MQIDRCIVEPPPPAVPWHDGIVEEGCPDQFGACLSVEAVKALVLTLERWNRWQREAWTRCGGEQ